MNEELSKRIQILTTEVNNLKNGLFIVDHFHTGFDASRIEYNNIANKRVFISHTLYGTSGATAANYGVFFISPFACTIRGFKEVHQTAGTDGSAVTLMLEKLTGTEAPGSGVDVLSTALSLKATANTVQDGTIIATIANKNLAIGERLCLEDTGTLTSVANVTVMVELQII